jgi:hypothetical protein
MQKYANRIQFNKPLSGRLPTCKLRYNCPLHLTLGASMFSFPAAQAPPLQYCREITSSICCIERVLALPDTDIVCTGVGERHPRCDACGSQNTMFAADRIHLDCCMHYMFCNCCHVCKEHISQCCLLEWGAGSMALMLWLDW